MLTRQFTRCYGDPEYDFSQIGNSMVPNQPPIHDARRPDRPRIETQIHRRKKAKAFSALEPEWDYIDEVPPSHLRMPSGRMAPAPPNRANNPS
ncbi:MAG: hypothetical protein EWM73_01087 [Nitrospira sp.]|nr:MAG: hypothetical protein EWM73_01087 [Nitrospira sp.]